MHGGHFYFAFKIKVRHASAICDHGLVCPRYNAVFIVHDVESQYKRGVLYLMSRVLENFGRFVLFFSIIRKKWISIKTFTHL